MVAPRDDKFIVFKVSEFDDVVDRFPASAGDMLRRVRVQDAVVIRRQDVFAPPALDAYANSITMLIEGASVWFASDVPEDVKRLREIADYFHAQAAASWDTSRRIPD